MSQDVWSAMDAYFEAALIPPDDTLQTALDRADAADLPEAQVAANQGKLLMLFAQMVGARRVLEIGTLAGYSTLWLARALPPDGHIVTLELSPDHAAVAQANFEAAGLADQIEIRIGVALDSLQALRDENAEPFDFVFIDADKPNNSAYFQAALALSRPGSVIFVDNVVRRGSVLAADSADENVHGVRDLIAMLENEPRVQATALQTVGAKGYDGFLLARVIA